MKKDLDCSVGSSVGFKGKKFIITNVLGFDAVLAKDAETGHAVRLHINDLTAPPDESSDGNQDKRRDLAEVPDKDKAIAEYRLSVIRPIVRVPNRTEAMVEKVAKKAGVHVATVYRWLEPYEKNERLSSLWPLERTGGRGKSRLEEEIDKIIDSTIEDVYLKEEQPTPAKTIRETIKRCKRAGHHPPHPNTIRNRIAALSEKKKMERRIGVEAARQKFEPTKGEFPGADWPLAVIQIDHTPLDVELVDDLDRRPIGKPWLTLEMDVCSRVIPGFYLSLDSPGNLSTGQCIANSILTKDKWLSKLGITNSWPIWGRGDTLHMDNAGEFHGDMLKTACKEYNMDLKWRPVKKPNYGGHIERMLGTFNQEIHNLPGTTFSNPQKRGKYKSAEKAIMTISELEKWLIEFITGVYHVRPHSDLNDMSPIQKFEEGIFGVGDKPGRGLPSRVIDEQRLRLDLMPFELRTVQKYGIVIDEIHYYSPVLNKWINAKEKDGRNKRKFMVRRDPRDISMIYFYDPEVKEYYSIPYRNMTRPRMSIWEYREARRLLVQSGRQNIDENAIFESYDRMRKIEDESAAKTRKARRAKQRRKMHQEASDEIAALRKRSDEIPEVTSALDRIAPFDDIDAFK